MTAMLYRGEHRRFRRLFEQRLDELREAVACPVEPAFHRSQVATSDVRNLGVALSLELPQYEHRPVVVGELPHALVHSLLEVALAVEVVRARGRVFELQRAVVGLPVLLDCLEQHERVPAAVAELVLRQVRRDRVDPGRELLGLVEPVQVPEYADEDLLDQVLGSFPVPDRAVDEIEQPGLVAVDQGAERLMVAGQVLEHHLAIVKLVQRLALQRAGGDGGLCLPFEGCSHKTGSVVSARNDPGTGRDLLLRSDLSHEPYPSPGDFTAISLSGKTTTSSYKSSAGAAHVNIVHPRGHCNRTAMSQAPKKRFPIKDSDNRLPVTNLAIPNFPQDFG